MNEEQHRLESNTVLIGRSSSHYTRTARIFALELGVPHAFSPVYDLRSRDPSNYSGNPALKVPSLVTPDGPWFGTENICRVLAQLSPKPLRVVLRGGVFDRRVANAEELTLQGMTTEVSVIMARFSGLTAGSGATAKLRQSLESSLEHLDAHLDEVLGLLPDERDLSFLEVALFCFVTHLPFREIIDVSRFDNLGDFCRRFGERASARATPYHDDVAP